MDPRSSQEQQRTARAQLEAELTAWRRQHPTATFQAIEQALDARLAHARAEVLRDLAQARTPAAWRQAPPAAHPGCPDCGTPLPPPGLHGRQVTTQGDQTVILERQDGVCPACGTGLHPRGTRPG